MCLWCVPFECGKDTASTVLSFLLGVLPLWEMVTVIGGLYMQMLGVLLPRRQVFQLTLH